MTQIARHVAAAVAALALTTLVAGCSSEQTAVADTPDVATPTAAALPASDFVEEGAGHSFATPSQRIQCRAVDHSFACQTEDSHTVATNDLCGFYPGIEQGRAVRFGFFNDRPEPCATIVQGDGFHSPHTLSYGQSVSFQIPEGRTVTCASAVEGLTCTQAGGLGAGGFFLSRDSFRVL